MHDTGFWVRPDQADRLATNYAAAATGDGIEVFDDAATSQFLREPTFLSGGGGLVSTAGDFLRFARMLLGNGRLDGERIIGRKTLELMAKNHLAGNRSMAEAVAFGPPDPAYFGNLPVDAYPPTVTLELARHAHDRVRQLLRRLIVVFTVSQQDRVSLCELWYRVEEPPSKRQPRPHRRASVRAELADRLVRGIPGTAVHLHHALA